jgi:LysR family glycine cleavage system transcriptional activator
LTHVGVDAPPPSPGLCFDDHTQMLAAAAAGHGVGLAKLFLAKDALAQGRLTRPFAQTAPNDFGYWLVAPKATAARPNVAAFRDWLLAEARTQDAPSKDRHLESRA